MGWEVGFPATAFTIVSALHSTLSIVSETAMTEEGGYIYSNVTGSRATDKGTLPGNRLPADGRDLAGEVLTPCEVSVTPDYDE